MNQIDQLILTLRTYAPGQLRTYAYTDWIGWLYIILMFLAMTTLSWWLRDKWVIDGDIAAGWIAFYICAIISGIMLLNFVPYSLHVFTTPELEAIKVLLNDLKR